MDIIGMEVLKLAEEEKQDSGQREREEPMTFMTLVILTGLIGGVFWSGLGYLAHTINLTEIHPRVILEPWTIGDWKSGWLGTVISLLLIGVISILAALIYYGTLRKFYSMWAGVAYGVILFLLVFFVLNPIFPSISPINELGRDTIITTVCLYILYGVFVGYSISYEEAERKYAEKREKEEQDAPSG